MRNLVFVLLCALALAACTSQPIDRAIRTHLEIKS